MAEQYRLYERAILPSIKISLAEQVHDILLREIHAGRWTIDDRLPGIATLAQMAALSRAPVQRAFEMLREEGYVRHDGPKGTFLISILPEGRVPFGAIGVLQRPGFPFFHTRQIYRVHAILQTAARHNYTVEVVNIETGEHWERLLQPNTTTEARLKGVISLMAPPCPPALAWEPGAMPIVFFGDFGRPYLPSVSGDSWASAYLMTKKCLAAGHRNIILTFSSQTPPREIREARVRAHEESMRQPGPTVDTIAVEQSSALKTGDALAYMQLLQTQKIRAHEEAMCEAGLTVDYGAIEQSSALNTDDILAYAQFLQTHSEASVVICSGLEVAKAVIAAARIQGIRVPEDLSVVSLGAEQPHLEEPPSTMEISRYGIDLSTMAEECFRVLLEQIDRRQCSCTHLQVCPRFFEGATFGAPRQSTSLFDVASVRERTGQAAELAP
jgi:DNA-binding LacI/PurR family transcriptional regulator